jgi:tRNA threonylcarbamoyladenosine biosynthesis protein TsaB
VRILALETATRLGSVALLDGDRLVERDVELRGDGAVAGLERLLAEESLDLRAVDAIGVSVGPGSFTGIRLGVAAAAGLGLAVGLPAIAVGTLDGIAGAAYDSDWGVSGTLCLASVDAGRGAVYAALYQATGRETAPRVLWGPELLTLEGLARSLLAAIPSPSAGRPGILAGPGAAALAPLFPPETGWDRPAIAARARAGTVARMAAEKFLAGDTYAPGELEPVYLRKSDAEIHRERKHPTRG